jgi:hypothetical protein
LLAPLQCVSSPLLATVPSPSPSAARRQSPERDARGDFFSDFFLVVVFRWLL